MTSPRFGGSGSLAPVPVMCRQFEDPTNPVMCRFSINVGPR